MRNFPRQDVGLAFRIAIKALSDRPQFMGIKYHLEVKDHKLDERFQRLHPGEATPKPGMRAPKKLTKKAAARLAAKNKPDEKPAT